MKFIETIKNKIKSKFEKTIDVQIYMKSGNVITLDKVIDYKFTPSISGVSSLTINRKVNAKSKLSVESICLSQIEAIVAVSK